MIEKVGTTTLETLSNWAKELREKRVEKLAKKEDKKPEGALDASKQTLEDLVEDSREKFAKKDVTQINPKTAEDLKLTAEIKRLKMWEDHVIAHERMHQLAGGEFAGAPSYTYTVGPDGKRYIQGGEVTMYVPAGLSLEDSEFALERVKRAATAPSDPSPQDSKTAAMASARQASVRAKIAKMKMREAYEKTKEMDISQRKLKGEEIQPLEKMKFSEVKAFDLFI